MAALSTLRGYVRDELGELTAGRWSDTQLNSWLNRGTDYIAGELHRGKCWDLLRELIKYREMTVAVGVTEYTMFDVINNVTASLTHTNNWYGYVHGMLGDYVLHDATLREFHRLNATTGEYAPSTTEPWIVWTGSDRATKKMTYTSGGSTEPAKDGGLLGASSAAYCRIAFIPEPTTGSWAGEDAAGSIYVFDDTGTFESETVGYQAPGTSSTNLDTLTCSAALSTESHANAPLFAIYPSLTTAATLKIWFMIKPIAMSAATDLVDLPYDCENLLIWWATAQAWQADRNFDMADRLSMKFERELAKKIATYQQTTFKSL